MRLTTDLEAIFNLRINHHIEKAKHLKDILTEIACDEEDLVALAKEKYTIGTDYYGQDCISKMSRILIPLIIRAQKELDDWNTYLVLQEISCALKDRIEQLKIMKTKKS